ncbi:MAG: alpha/beta hydrolase [Pseudomonadota bacterium]
MESQPLTRETVPITVDGVDLSVSAMHRQGDRPPLVLLHGFGSTKEDYADLAQHPRFAGRRLIAYDAPGCGATACGDLSRISIPFLQRTADELLDRYGAERFHLAGHSMGGLTALLLADALADARADALGDRVLSLTSIEGNLAPEDCFLSRQILDHPADDPEAFFAAFQERAWQTPAWSSPLFAASLAHKVRAEAVGPIFRSMVEISDGQDLLTLFTALPCPKMFVHGDQNGDLSYLGELVQRGAQVAEIAQSGHWPMYANPPALWVRLADFIDQADTHD